MSNPASSEAIKAWEEAINKRWDLIENLEQKLEQEIGLTRKQIDGLLDQSVDQQIQREFRRLIKPPKSITDSRDYYDWKEKTYAKIPAEPTKIPKAVLSRLARNIQTNGNPLPGQIYDRGPPALTRERNAAKFEAAADPALLPHLRAIDERRRAKFEEKRRQNRVLSFLLGPETQK